MFRGRRTLFTLATEGRDKKRVKGTSVFTCTRIYAGRAFVADFIFNTLFFFFRPPFLIGIYANAEGPRDRDRDDDDDSFSNKP